MPTDLLGAIRKWLAWRLFPAISKSEAKQRFRLMEPGTYDDAPDEDRREARDQIKQLQRQLGIDPTRKPAPYNVDDRWRERNE